MKTIFVGIAAYNEPDLVDTILSCFNNAKHPDRVHVGVWDHKNNMENIDINLKNVKVAHLRYESTLGTSIARLNAMSMYDNEDYYLQIDAHMLFEKNWDEKIINSFQNIKTKYEKPIISTYVPWWSRNEDGTINHYSSEDNSTVCSPMTYDHEILNEKFPKQKTYPVDWNSLEYAEHYCISAHFTFVEGKFIDEILPDPFLLFAGEEPVTAMRAWTRGYRIFAIKNPIVWHKNKFDGVNHKFDRLNYGGNKDLDQHYHRKDIKCVKRTKDILTGEILGYWGSPTLELLQDYEKHAKIDFKDFYKKMGEV